MSPAARGLWLGVAAMAMFGMTLPMTQLATGTAAAPQFSPLFVTCARAVVAAALSALWLCWVRAPWPSPGQWRLLAVAAAGNALGYPLMVAFSLWRAQQSGLGWRPSPADAWLALGVLAASVGYVAGARVTPALGAERTICWVTLAALPVTLPGALLQWPAQPPLASVPWSAWLGLAYVSLFSMWIAFFAWYRALAQGDAVRVSQVQLLQPFFAMLFAWPIHGQPVALAGVGFGLAVIATVWLGRRFSAASPAPAAPPAGPPSPATWTR